MKQATPRRRRGRVVMALTAVTLFGSAAAAQASTITANGTTYTYDAAAGINQDVFVDDGSAAGEVEFYTPDDPVTGTLPATCTDTGSNHGSPPAGTYVTCTGATGYTVNAGDGNDTLRAYGSIPGTLNGQDGDDYLYSNVADGVTITMDGGAGDDEAYGNGDNPDIMLGGAGRDDLRAGRGNDTVDGGAGDDYRVVGGPGNDVVNGGDGDDNNVFGGPGSDTVNGGAGDDYVSGGAFGSSGINDPDPANAQFLEGNDVVNGGTGIDTLEVYNYFYDVTAGNNVSLPINVSLDDVANDGRAGEADNYGSDIEDVSISSLGNDDDAGATITGTSGINGIYGSNGGDTIDAGAGNDFVFAYNGNDTVNSRDGYADRVDCGAGTDVANVDQFDQVSSNCETVNVEQRANANDVPEVPEDVPPTVTWAAPAENAVLSNGTNTLTVNATDDRGVTQVVFLAGPRVVCVVKAAPYTCTFKAQDEEVGKTTLTAIAYDAAQQTSTALRFVTLKRFKATSLSSKVSPKTDKKPPFSFKTSGKLTLPDGVSADVGCVGRVTVRIKVNKKTISTRRVKLSKGCTYSSRVTFKKSQRITASKLRVFASFGGNAVLLSRSASTKKVTVTKTA
jgi:Ca2+-binding RTX toxin-like protein